MPPERLQKILAQRGYGSRRSCEEIIRSGRVTLNGQTARLGEKGDPGEDRIEVDGQPIGSAPQPVFLMLHKPAGFVTTRNDPHAKKTVMDLLPEDQRNLFPVG